VPGIEPVREFEAPSPSSFQSLHTCFSKIGLARNKKMKNVAGEGLEPPT
jgi:hypothetical protein